MRPLLLILIFALSQAPPLAAQNCDRSPTGLIPLTDMGTVKYKGFAGGLYPKGSNLIPASHSKLGLALAKSIQPLDKSGKPSTTGKIVILAIGMSNATQEFSAFVHLARMDYQNNDNLVVVDGAVGGHDATKVANPRHNYWNIVQQRLNKAGVTAAQVQVFWLKQALARPTKGFPADALTLRDLLVKIAQNLRSKYPHGKLCFASSRIYAGYATTKLNPEPYAYESGFSVKWLIQRQIQGDKTLNADSRLGVVKAPWLGWGPYLWADGLKPRRDGLRWWCDEFRSDGTHPSDSGRWKVADLLLEHFRSSPIANPWYYGGKRKPPATTLVYGMACKGKTGYPKELFFGRPTVGNVKFAIGESNIPANSIAVALISNRRDFAMLGARCDLLVDLGKLIFFHPIVTSGQGTVHMYIPVTNHAAMLGAEFYCQWLNLDPGGTYVSFGGVSLSRGLHVLVGR
jgi:hypothetical protein